MTSTKCSVFKLSWPRRTPSGTLLGTWALLVAQNDITTPNLNKEMWMQPDTTACGSQATQSLCDWWYQCHCPHVRIQHILHQNIFKGKHPAEWVREVFHGPDYSPSLCHQQWAGHLPPFKVLPNARVSACHDSLIQSQSPPGREIGV